MPHMDAQNPESQATGLPVPDSQESEHDFAVASGNDPESLSSDFSDVEFDESATRRASIQPAIIRAEANFLRFPLFKLSTKGLRNCEGFEALGRKEEGGKSADFTYRVTRNTDDMYPGLLSRSCHQAALAKLEKTGFPFQKNVDYTWRELATLMQVSWSGKNVARYKAAIKATHGLRIWSDLALKQKSIEVDPETQEESSIIKPFARQEHGFQLYQEVLFQGEMLPDGTELDTNRIVLSDWYVNNLNSFYYAKLDRHVWLAIDSESPIASRLYEYLLHSHSGNWQKIRIGYAKLCSYLPIAVKATPSQAQDQLKRVFEVLRTYDIVRNVTWSRNSTGELMLTVVVGDKLRTSKTPSSTLDGEPCEIISVREIVNTPAPHVELIKAFFAKWFGEQPRAPWSKELLLAKEVIDDYGSEKATDMVPLVVKMMRAEDGTGFPTAGGFGATRAFWERAHNDLLAKKAAQRAAVKKAKQKKREDDKRAKEREQFNRDKAAFLALPEDEQARFHELAMAAAKPFEQQMIRRNEDTRLRYGVYEYQRQLAE